MKKVLAVVLAVSFLGVVFAAPLRAATWKKKTVVIFGQRVEISGHVLAAGTYVFQLDDSSSNRHVVQILSGDGRTIIATVLAIPNYHVATRDGTAITFNDAAAGSPQTIRVWFYPGSSVGQEFVYPKPRAIQLAKATNLVVPALAGDGPVGVANADALKMALIVAIAPDGTEAPVALNPTTASDDTSGPARARPTARRRTWRPKAESDLPRTAAFGLGAILVACGAVALTRREPGKIL
jgi:hypothetical protein